MEMSLTEMFIAVGLDRARRSSSILLILSIYSIAVMIDKFAQLSRRRERVDGVPAGCS